MRRGIVLGGGGVLGAAWMTGALSVVAERLGWDAREADVLVGTSAGSVLAALLGSGIPVASLVNHQLGRPSPDDQLFDFDTDRAAGGSLPPLPRFGIGSAALLARAAARPRRYPPLAAFSAVLPRGRASLASVEALVEAVRSPGGWVDHPATWVIAMDYDRGRRVAFGRPGAPPATLERAVSASCAIPGWYTPVLIGGRRYVDGGTCSPVSADLLVDQGLDEVVVLAPMASFDMDEPASVVGRLERRFRRAMTRRVVRETEKLRLAGTRVTVLAPGREDLQVIGVNLMDPARRREVLETALRTVPRVLDQGAVGGGRRPGAAGLPVAG